MLGMNYFNQAISQTLQPKKIEVKESESEAYDLEVYVPEYGLAWELHPEDPRVNDLDEDTADWTNFEKAPF